MCCLNAFPRRNLPFFVRLKRFAAPRCVLIFSFFSICPRCFTAETAKNAEKHFSLRAPRARRFLLIVLSRRRRRGSLRLAAAALRALAQDGVHLIAFHPRHRLRD